MRLSDSQVAGGFEDIHLVHNCLPEINPGEVDLSASLCGIRLTAPLYINAITGGSTEVIEANARLARVAARTGLALAVGSQRAALDDPSLAETYRVARDNYPNGVLMANVSAGTHPEMALRAVDMIRADLLQIHLNSVQEMLMEEGERDFRGWLKNIACLARTLPVPVVVKEVGFGIAVEQAKQLAEVGVRAIDASGTGGTNFAAVEISRSGRAASKGLVTWGIPTPISVVETASVPGVQVLASGGIRSGVDVLKALALGATAAGVAGPVLRAMASGGEDWAVQLLEDWITEIRQGLALLGQVTVGGMRRCPVVISGLAAEWLRARGFDPNSLARRRRSRE